MSNYYSNGKLLITGEYTVLDGALALAVPTKYGQSLKVTPISENKIIWKSIDCADQIWFEDEIKIKDLSSSYLKTSNATSQRLIQVLNAIQLLSPDFFDIKTGFSITTKLDFPRNWGLGSSSTLINNIALWANVDAYKLLELTFGGSGYDIACAQHHTAITYQLNNLNPEVNEIDFNPEFKDCLYFIHLNEKKNSREGIKHYNTNKPSILEDINKVNIITKNIIDCRTLTDFNMLINTHELIISSIIKQPTVKESLFNDFNGAIKSLGAWGGDFILVSSIDNPSSYFKQKGYPVIISYSDMVLN